MIILIEIVIDILALRLTGRVKFSYGNYAAQLLPAGPDIMCRGPKAWAGYVPRLGNVDHWAVDHCTCMEMKDSYFIRINSS